MAKEKHCVSRISAKATVSSSSMKIALSKDPSKQRQQVVVQAGKISLARRTGKAIDSPTPPLKVYSDKNLHLANVARRQGLTVGQFLGLDDMPKPDELASKYVCQKPLARRQQFPLIQTQMKKLHEWNEEITKGDRKHLMVAVRNEHYYREDSIDIELEELFQFFTLDALYKSVVSSYFL
jgi:hypothetical protein